MKPAAQRIAVGFLCLSLGAVTLLGALPQLRASEQHHTSPAGLAIVRSSFSPAPMANRLEITATNSSFECR